MKRTRPRLKTMSSILILSSVFAGCGKPTGLLDSNAESPGAPGEAGPTEIPVNGYAGFASQCPYGSISAPNAADLELWSCPVGLQSLELREPIEPLLMSVDCTKKLITVRTFDRRIDTMWEILPDGKFTMTIDGLTAKIKDDGQRNTDCSTPIQAYIDGHLQCADRDKVDIQFETVWWLNTTGRGRPSPTPSASPLPRPSGSPTPVTSPSPSVTPRPSPSPSLSPSPSPTPSPSPSPTRTASPTPTASVAPTVTVTVTFQPPAPPHRGRIPWPEWLPRPGHRSYADTPSPTPSAAVTPTVGGKCNFPTSCYMYTPMYTLKQCQ